MLNSNKYIIFAFLLSACIVVSPAYAKKSKIKGDPELVWLLPFKSGDNKNNADIGSGAIENNAYTRCRLIKLLKPGPEETTATNQYTYDILTNYATNLYAQSIKLSDYIEAEKENSDTSEPDLSDEKALLDEEVTKRLGDIARRMNIIISFEAGTMLLESLNSMVELLPTAYDSFRVYKGGKIEYSSDCEDLK